MISNSPIPTNTLILIAGVLCCLVILIAVGGVGVFFLLRSKQSTPHDRPASPARTPSKAMPAGQPGVSHPPGAEKDAHRPYIQSHRLATQLQPLPGAPAQPPQPMPARLIVTAGFTGQVVWDLPAQGIIIGRQSDSGVALDDPIASRHHARVDYTGGIWSVTDLHSKNGTLVNGERILCKELHTGDKIQVGQTTLMFLGGKPK